MKQIRWELMGGDYKAQVAQETRESVWGMRFLVGNKKPAF
jgi:hypothetical protein